MSTQLTSIPTTKKPVEPGAPEHKNVHAAKLAVMKEVGYVQKQRSNGLNYTFAGEAALIAALRPVMIEHGLTITPISSRIVESSTYSTRNGGEMRLVRTEETFRITHAPSGTSEDITMLGEGADAGDKTVSKALTCGYKYFLRQTFMIETGDDPDQHASVEAAPLRNDQGGVRPKITQADVDAAAKNAVTRLQTGNVGNRPESSFATAKYPPTDKQVNFLNSLLRKHGIPEYHGPEAVKRLANSMYTGGKEVRISIDALKAADDCPSSLLDLVFVEEAVEVEPEFSDGDLPY